MSDCGASLRTECLGPSRVAPQNGSQTQPLAIVAQSQHMGLRHHARTDQHHIHTGLCLL